MTESKNGKHQTDDATATGRKQKHPIYEDQNHIPTKLIPN
jgi:hypothetical protein